jgi:hypothetical protein
MTNTFKTNRGKIGFVGENNSYLNNQGKDKWQ